LVGRYGGEECLVVFPTCPSDNTVNYLNRLPDRLAELEFFTDTGELVKITLSTGVAELTETDKDLAAFIERADIALYKAKAEGRNRVLAAQDFFYSHSGLNNSSTSNIMLTTDRC